MIAMLLAVVPGLRAWGSRVSGSVSSWGFGPGLSAAFLLVAVIGVGSGLGVVAVGWVSSLGSSTSASASAVHAANSSDHSLFYISIHLTSSSGVISEPAWIRADRNSDSVSTSSSFVLSAVSSEMALSFALKASTLSSIDLSVSRSASISASSATTHSLLWAFATPIKIRLTIEIKRNVKKKGKMSYI